MNKSRKDDLHIRLRRMSDRISSLILYSDLPWIDIQLQIEQMRALCLEYFPESEQLFEYLYERRFIRLWEQWRAPEEEDDF